MKKLIIIALVLPVFQSCSLLGLDSTDEILRTEHYFRIINESRAEVTINYETALTTEENRVIIVPTGDPFYYYGSFEHKIGDANLHIATFGSETGPFENISTFLDHFSSSAFIAPINSQPKEFTPDLESIIELDFTGIIGDNDPFLLEKSFRVQRFYHTMTLNDEIVFAE